MPIYDGVPGGQELLRWFGLVPSFHDAEVLGFYLNRNGPSVLRLHWWITTNRTRADGYFMLEKHTLVTFTLQGIMDLQLENFSAQNVIGGLNLRRATDRPDRRNHLTLDPLPQDIEIELEHVTAFAVLFVHDPSQSPLSRANQQSRVAATGMAASMGGHLAPSLPVSRTTALDSPKLDSFRLFLSKPGKFRDE